MIGNSSMQINKEHQLFPWLGDKTVVTSYLSLCKVQTQLATPPLRWGAALPKQLYVAKSRSTLRDHW